MWKVYCSELFGESSIGQVLYGNNILNSAKYAEKVLAVCFLLHELWKRTIQQR